MEYRITAEHRRQWAEFPYLMARHGSNPSGREPGLQPAYDKPLDCPERDCSNCGEPFQPTKRRRMLCSLCFRNEDRGGAL